jgi:hypothetical protein
VARSESQIAHWQRTVALYAYVDDSGSSPNEPIYVLGGLILPDEMWSMFSNDWKSVRDQPPSIEYFKASEVWDRTKGPFRDMTAMQRRNKVDSFSDVITTYKPLTISCSLKWDTFNSFSKSVRLIPELDDPYFFLFFGIIGQMLQLGKDEPLFRSINFVFDSQNKIEKRVKLWYAVFLRNATDAVLQLLGERWPEFSDEKITMPLQGADLFAWYQRRSSLKNLGDPFHVNVWERIRKDRFYATEIATAGNLHSMATDLRALISP